VGDDGIIKQSGRYTRRKNEEGNENIRHGSEGLVDTFKREMTIVS
jgi:hypothetical protein